MLDLTIELERVPYQLVNEGVTEARIFYDGTTAVVHYQKGKLIATIYHENNPTDWLQASIPNCDYLHGLEKIDENRFLVLGYNRKQGGCLAYIFQRDSQILHSFPCGEGISDLLATAKGEFWLSYMDEGVFSGDLLANQGLNQFNLKGEVLWQARQAGLDIYDCYAINDVSNNEFWFYYYGKFSLVRFSNGKITHFGCPINGAGTFTIVNNLLIMDKGYQKHHEFSLLQQERNHQFKPVGQLTFLNEEGVPFDKHQTYYKMRKNKVVVRTKSGFYSGTLDLYGDYYQK